MEDIESLKKSLEESISSLNNNRNVSFNVRRGAIGQKEKKIQEIYSWETEAMHFRILDGETKAAVFNPSKDVTLVSSFPSHDNFTPDTYKYFSERADETKNDFLIIRYNQLLWKGKSSKKHESQPKNIIDASLRILKLSSEELINDEKKFENGHIIENALIISTKIRNYRIEELKSIFHDTFLKEDSSEHLLKVGAIQFISNSKKIFTQEELEKTLRVAELVFEVLLSENDTFCLTELTVYGGRIATKLNLSEKDWIEKRAFGYENFSRFRMNDESRMIPLSYLAKAINEYRIAGNKEKAEELGKEYSKLKSELKLQKVRIPFDSEASKLLSKYINSLVELLISKESKFLFSYLATSKEVFPTKEWIQKLASENKMSFMDFASLISFDINNNIKSNGIPTAQEKFYEQYSIYFNSYTINFLNILFAEGIKARVITYESLIIFFLNESWLGQTLEEINKEGEIREYNWVSNIAPSLLEFFIQYESALLSDNHLPNFLLAVDSLILKFEGIIRDFAKRHNINTVMNTRSGGTREMFIDDILNNKELEDKIDISDIEYFKFIFTSKGYNLRNNIAHSFYKLNDYSQIQVVFVITAILRLSNYKINKKLQ